MADSFVIQLPASESVIIGVTGYFLTSMQAAGCIVPSTYVLSQYLFDEFVTFNKRKRNLIKLSISNKLSANQKSKEIYKILTHAHLPNIIEDELATIDFRFPLHLKVSPITPNNFPERTAHLLRTIRVETRDALTNSIKECWADYWNSACIDFRMHHGIIQEYQPLAIIIQEYTDYALSGTIHLNYQNSGHLISYAKYNTFQLNGHIMPNIIAVNSDESIHILHQEFRTGSLTSSQILQLVNQLVKALDKIPDVNFIHWLHNNDTFVITHGEQKYFYTPISNDPAYKIRTRAWVDELLPQITTPMSLSIFHAIMHNDFERAFDQSINGTLNGYITQTIRGHVYLNLSALVQPLEDHIKITPSLLRYLFGLRLSPEFITLFGKGSSNRLEKKLKDFRHRFLSKAVPINQVKLPSMPEAAPVNFNRLVQWNIQAFRQFKQSWEQLLLTLSRWYEASQLHSENYPDSTSATNCLLPHIHLKSLEPVHELWLLGQQVRDNARLIDILFSPSPWAEKMPRITHIEGGIQFIIPFRRIIDKVMNRAQSELDLQSDRWGEQPQFIIKVLRLFIKTDSAIATMQKRAASTTNSVTEGKYGANERLVKLYEQHVAAYEQAATDFHRGLSALRKTILEIGANAVVSRRLTYVNDIFFLTPSEISEIDTSEDIQTLNERIRERHENHIMWQSLDPLELIDQQGHAIIQETIDPFQGVACSPGIVEGYARVMDDPAQISTLEPGEILVLCTPDPIWTFCLLSCIAIVTERGGAISTIARAARAYNIPAVCGVPNATSSIRTGDIIRVDGNKGCVEILDIRG
ncbi:hypothetical protein JW960_26400 [candidate division KSB1 bacterium]|nr:hypothetical protein [candidate division KSB1 bacterium]